MRLTLNKSYDQNEDKLTVKTPEYFPRRETDNKGVKIVRSTKLIHCVTENGVTKCFGTSARLDI